MEWTDAARRRPVGRWARCWTHGLPAGVFSALVIGVPTDVIDNPWFSRMTPVSWWELPILVATAALTALWFALPSGSGSAGGARVSGISVLGTLAVGCPICNKIVVALLGVSGALAVWAPLQPVLGAVSVGLVLLAVIAKARLSSRQCPVPAPHDADAVATEVPSG